jgi:hypothetical protein
MTKPTIRIHDTVTDEVIDREMTDDEFAVYQINVAKAEELKAQDEAKAEARAALLDRLGITEDEAKLLLS